MRFPARSWPLCFAALVIALLAAAAAHAATCNVPTTSYPTLGAAARDAGCTLVQLTAGGFPENVTLARDLAIAGAGSAATTLQGDFFVAGAACRLFADGFESGGLLAWSAHAP